MAEKSFPLHRAVWAEDLGAVRGLVEGGAGLEERDPAGRTALGLAVALGRLEAARLLLAAGADATAESGEGWSVCHEAVAAGDPELLRLCLHHRHLQRKAKTQTATARLLANLRQTPDFYAEMSWEFASWLPLVASVCPSDTYKVYKRGSSVRVDATLIGFNSANEWERGRQSFLFLGSESGDSVEAVVLDHDRRTAESQTLLAAPDPSAPTPPMPSEDEVAKRLTSPILTTFVDLDKVAFERSKTGLFWKAEREEVVNEYPCKVFQASNVRLVTKTRREHLSRREREEAEQSKEQTPIHSLLSFVQGSEEAAEASASHASAGPVRPELYFDPAWDGPRHLGRPKDVTQKAQSFKATLWLAADFPLSLEEQITPIVDLMAVNNAHFQRLKNFIQLQLPAGFPVKIEIPLFHVIKANITFGNVNGLRRPVEGVSTGEPGLAGQHCIVDERLFAVPSNYVQRRELGPGRGGAGGGFEGLGGPDDDVLLQWAIQQSLAGEEETGDGSAAPALRDVGGLGDELSLVLQLSRQEEEERLARLAQEEDDELQRALQASLAEQ